MATKTTPPKKFVGSIGWVEQSGDVAPIKRAIVHSKNKITLECEFGGLDYGVTLIRKSKFRYEGNFAAGVNSGAVSCTLYWNDDANLLIGEWIEDDFENMWWARLQAVDHFPDER